jgi:hypothetical protein
MFIPLWFVVVMLGIIILWILWLWVVLTVLAVFVAWGVLLALSAVPIAIVQAVPVRWRYTAGFTLVGLAFVIAAALDWAHGSDPWSSALLGLGAAVGFPAIGVMVDLWAYWRRQVSPS